MHWAPLSYLTAGALVKGLGPLAYGNDERLGCYVKQYDSTRTA